MQTEQRFIKNKFLLFIYFVIAGISSYFLAKYLAIPFPEITWLILFFILVLINKSTYQFRLLRKEILLLGIFCLLFALSIIASHHIVITSDPYSGTSDANYISTYSLIDVVGLLFVFSALFLFFTGLFLFIKFKPLQNKKSFTTSKIPLKQVVLLSLIPFLLWLPYLLAYWPGFIFGDSLFSLRQALWYAEWNNHHPFLYTMFIKLCLWIGRLIGIGNTGGCVIYSLCQMVFMALCFAYLARWISERAQLKKRWSVVIVVICALSPYLATFSISMWKDPWFSCALMILTLLVFDFIRTRGKILKSNKTWLIGFIAMVFIILFTRNNGVYIIALLELAFLGCLIGALYKKKDNKQLTLISSCTAITLAIFLIVSGPIYKALGVSSSENAESLGIPLSQMARVVVQNGNMTDFDKDYMASILPLEDYSKTYRPCCIDRLKNSDSFNNDALENDFFAHWASMLTKNPGTYLEAWELQTFGFWAINQPVVWNHGNISAGVPRNLNSNLEIDITSLNIFPGNIFSSDTIRDYLPINNPSIPIGVVLWLVLYLCVCLILLNKKSWLIALLPTLGLLATLLIASPIWYWPRYGAAVQFLIPFYLLLFYLLKKQATTYNEEALDT